jgi:pimeloyl-ACP methyl ester carboxylesterase
MPTLTVNGAELYHEVRGDGPRVLLMMGMTGDASHFETLAGLLADEFTVVSYDRRGNGCSPRPAGWATTSPEEQADDAAALLTALSLSRAAVFGSSARANFALCLLLATPRRFVARCCTRRCWCSCSTIRKRAGRSRRSSRRA